MRRVFAILMCSTVLACSAILTAPEDEVPPPTALEAGALDGAAPADGGAPGEGADATDAADACTGGCDRKFEDVTQLVAGETHVFVAYRDGVARCSSTSCDRRPFPPVVAGADARAIAVDLAGKLHVTSKGVFYTCDGSPFECTPERSGITELANDPAVDLVVLSTTFVWTTRGQFMYQTSRTGVDVPSKTNTARAAAPLAQVGDGAAFGNSNGLWRADNAGGNHVELAPGIASVSDLASSPNKLAAILSDRSGVLFMGHDGTSGGSRTIGVKGALALALTTTTAYWTTDTGEIARCDHSVANPSVTTYVGGLASPRHIAVNASDLWFTTGANADGTGLATLERRTP